jgi:DNA-binding MarR family transcriptional regulator
MPASEYLDLGLLLFSAYRTLENRVVRALAEAGYSDVTAAQARVFQRIAPGGTRQTDLAEQTQLAKQTVGFLVDQLERSGYVERTPDPADARARLVRVSAKGAGVAARAAAVTAAVESEWTAHLGPQRMAQLRRALCQVRELCDPYG